MSQEFSSEGFDLDAIPSSKAPANSNDDAATDVIYEIGGNATTVPTHSPKDEAGNSSTSTSSNAAMDPLATAEQHKSEGNAHFKAGNYLDAYDSYSDAMEACPGISGKDILKLREEHEEKEREKAHAQYEKAADRRRKMPPSTRTDSEETQERSQEKEDGEEEDDSLTEVKFEPPKSEYGTKLAVYHCNRAACLLHLHRYDAAIEDCDVAILLNPTYTKAYVRRMTAYEKTERTEEALRDAKAAQAIDPTNRDVRNHVKRLQKLEDERLEKVKEETMGKLKDLGNSILGNFGMSLDNFKAQKDPKTGS